MHLLDFVSIRKTVGKRPSKIRHFYQNGTFDLFSSENHTELCNYVVKVYNDFEMKLCLYYENIETF